MPLMLNAVLLPAAIGAGDFTPRTARATIEQGACDLIAFGRWFLANPDLLDRINDADDLNSYARSTFTVTMKKVRQIIQSGNA